MPRYRSAEVRAVLAAMAVPGTCLLVLMCGASAGAQAAELQDAVGGPPPVYDPQASGTVPGGAAPAAETAAAAPATPRRPRFSMGVGMGVSFDSTGFVDSRTVAVPAFQVQLGVGEEFLGFEVRMFSTQASGRYHQRAASRTMLAAVDGPTDRLAVDLLVAIRPFAAIYRGDPRWSTRVLKSVTINAGAAGENATTGTPAVVRFGSVLGFHIDLPLVPPDPASALSLRITGRKMAARQAYAAMTAVTDTVGEIFGGLALSF